MPWGVAAAAVGAAGTIYASNQSSKAAKAGSKGADAAAQVQWDMYDQTRQDQAASRALGNSALAQLGIGIGSPLSNQVTQTKENFDPVAYLRDNPDVAANDYFRQNPFEHYQQYGQNEGRSFDYAPGTQPSTATGTSSGIGLGDFNKKFTLADYQADPGYQFRLDEGTKALERSAAARGGLLGGRQLKDLTNYQQGVASQEYGNAYDRFNNDNSLRFNRLATLAGIGQTANGTLASAGSNTAANVGNYITQGANANAAGIVGSANAITNGVGQGISAYQNSQYLKALSSPTSSGGASGNYYNDYSSVA